MTIVVKLKISYSRISYLREIAFSMSRTSQMDGWMDAGRTDGCRQEGWMDSRMQEAWMDAGSMGWMQEAWDGCRKHGLHRTIGTPKGASFTARISLFNIAFYC